MNSTCLHRAVRKLVRPLRRRLQNEPPSSSIEDFSGGCLILIAHPDDEVFCSGLICELRAKGVEVHLVCFTRGEGGERGQLSENSDLGQEREKELKKASEILGCSSLTLLDYIDPLPVKEELTAPSHDSAELLAELETLITKYSPTNLITHGSSGEYWHPAHLCLHRHARILNRRLPRLQLWTYNAWSPEHPLQGILNQDDLPSFTLDTSVYHEQRLQALASHNSQQAVFERFAKGKLTEFISQTAIESYRKW